MRLSLASSGGLHVITSGSSLKTLWTTKRSYGIERLGLERASRALDGLRQMAHFGNQRVVSHRAVMIHVHDHASRLGIARLKNPVEEKLQVVQRLLTASDKAVRFVSKNLQHLVPVALLLFDLEDKAEITKHGIENFPGRKITAHGAARFFLFLAVVASLFATTLFFSSVGSGLFRVR